MFYLNPLNSGVYTPDALFYSHFINNFHQNDFRTTDLAQAFPHRLCLILQIILQKTDSCIFFPGKGRFFRTFTLGANASSSRDGVAEVTIGAQIQNKQNKLKRQHVAKYRQSVGRVCCFLLIPTLSEGMSPKLSERPVKTLWF